MAFFNRVLSIIYKVYLQSSKNISIGGNFLIMSLPRVLVYKQASLIIGDNVTLTSKSSTYHSSLFCRTKLLLDRKGSRLIIGNNTRIHGSCIHASNSILIGENCLIAANCQIFDSNGHRLSMENPVARLNTTGVLSSVVINDNVWIGVNSIILPGVVIGEGSVVAAGSVVTKSFPSHVLIGGNPAVILKKYD